METLCSYDLESIRKGRIGFQIARLFDGLDFGTRSEADSKREFPGLVENTLMSRSNSRSIILQRIRQALNDVPHTDHRKAIDRNCRMHSDMPDDECISRLSERGREYTAEVRIGERATEMEAVLESLRSRNARRVVVAPGFPDKGLLEDEFTVVKDEPVPLSNKELDGCDAVVTSSFLGIAETGTIILNGSEGQGRRALSLIPDFHVCVVPSSRIRGIVPEAIEELNKVIKQNPAPVTFISGPSATSDIELNRVEGVHGPRTLHVIISVG